MQTLSWQVGLALSPHLASAGMDSIGLSRSLSLSLSLSVVHVRRTSASRSDTFFACFPGDGLGYGSHYDVGNRARLTSTCSFATHLLIQI